jgi:D-alanyl-D-alanine carboxypeptidase
MITYEEMCCKKIEKVAKINESFFQIFKYKMEQNKEYKDMYSFKNFKTEHKTSLDEIHLNSTSKDQRKRETIGVHTGVINKFGTNFPVFI